MRQLIIGFSHARSPFAIGSSIIAISERQSYSHVYICCKDSDTDLDMVYQASRGYVNSMTYGRFQKANVICREYFLSCEDTTFKQIMKFMKSSLGLPYSRLQIIAIAIKRLFKIEINVYNRDAAFICSEFGTRVAQIGGIKYGKNLDFTTPEDVDKLLKANNIPCTIYGVF